eukprot:TRINITY_DN15124_c0_g1_i1.p1 TRINITY_DN15124_c0_g1~~TRINITY_DN15124_c0_g1_i1.p1  ORF type:complete len:331 (-),score=48.09 TRINITY_DN15124_c0_g1_i1:157-1149(-)
MLRARDCARVSLLSVSAWFTRPLGAKTHRLSHCVLVSWLSDAALQAQWKAKCDWLKCIGSAIVKGAVGVAAAMVSYCAVPIVIEHRWSTATAFITTFLPSLLSSFLHSSSVCSGVSVSGIKWQDFLWLGCLVLCVTSVAAEDMDVDTSGGGSAAIEIACAAVGAGVGYVVARLAGRRAGTSTPVSLLRSEAEVLRCCMHFTSAGHQVCTCCRPTSVSSLRCMSTSDDVGRAPADIFDTRPCAHVQEYDIVGSGHKTTLAVPNYNANLSTALTKEAEVQQLRTGNRFSIEDGVSDGEDDPDSDDDSGTAPVAKKRTKSGGIVDEASVYIQM